MTEIIISISWWIMKALSFIGWGWAKKKGRKKTAEEIEIPINGKKIKFITERSFPIICLKFEIRSQSDVKLTPKQLIAKVICNNVTIDKINWSEQEKILDDMRKAKGNTSTETYNNIPDLPAEENRDFELHYPLPLNVDFGMGLSLRGIIEFDSIFGTIVKEFHVSFTDMGNEWPEALDKWKESWKTEKTIITHLLQYPIQIHCLSCINNLA
ncbi:MAG: hypothetical protein KAR85_05000 [Methanosarcinales archaeon]|nr:hypothetical protein [Methanosarcinales archaeon]